MVDFPLIAGWCIVYTGWWFGTLYIYICHIFGIIIPTDELIFFRGVGIPPTSYTHWKLAVLKSHLKDSRNPVRINYHGMKLKMDTLWLCQNSY